MENTQHPTEDDPLKGGGDPLKGVEDAGTQKEGGCWRVLDLSNLTRCRTIVFFVSLAVCLGVVFAFSFFVPCPDRPQYLVTWNRSFPDAASYDFLAIGDANGDKVMDVLFVLKGSEGTKNASCSDAGQRSPCAFLSAVDGTDGETLWDRPLAADFRWARCGLGKGTGRSWDCLVSHAGRLTAVDKRNGDVIWQQPHPTAPLSSAPALSLPDLDEDQVGDVALVASDGTQTQVALLSGREGAPIGSTVLLDSAGTAHLLHRTAEGSHYILLQKDTGLYALALWRVVAQAKPGAEANLKKDQHLEKSAGAATGLVHIFESDEVRWVVRTEGTDETSALLVVTGREVALVDGKRLEVRWRFNSSSVLSQPSCGHFNRDESLDVMVEEDIGNDSKRVFILDGKSGAVLWEVNLLASPNSPRPASVHTTNLVSIFMFWGLMPSGSNSSVPSADDRCSYMLHPLYSKVLLEFSNMMDHIISFRATLMERGRHAAYILLTGPVPGGAGGTVVLTKRKLKQDVPLSSVRPIGDGGSETDEDIFEAFNRLRFSDS